jgi:hypothetical protein
MNEETFEGRRHFNFTYQEIKRMIVTENEEFVRDCDNCCLKGVEYYEPLKERVERILDEC